MTDSTGSSEFCFFSTLKCSLKLNLSAEHLGSACETKLNVSLRFSHLVLIVYNLIYDSKPPWAWFIWSYEQWFGGRTSVGSATVCRQVLMFSLTWPLLALLCSCHNKKNNYKKYSRYMGYWPSARWSGLDVQAKFFFSPCLWIWDTVWDSP